AFQPARRSCASRRRVNDKSRVRDMTMKTINVRTLRVVAAAFCGLVAGGAWMAQGHAQTVDPIAFCRASGLNVIIGTQNNDVLNGTPGADCIVGLGFQDTINAGGGDDIVFGGEGNDV